MAQFAIGATQTVSTVTYVEAETLEEAIDKQYQQGWMQLMFLDHRYPDEGEWEIDEGWTYDMNEDEDDD